jgi:hypothetical protein
MNERELAEKILNEMGANEATVDAWDIKRLCNNSDELEEAVLTLIMPYVEVIESLYKGDCTHYKLNVRGCEFKTLGLWSGEEAREKLKAEQAAAERKKDRDNLVRASIYGGLAGAFMGGVTGNIVIIVKYVKQAILSILQYMT